MKKKLNNQSSCLQKSTYVTYEEWIAAETGNDQLKISILGIQ